MSEIRFNIVASSAEAQAEIRSLIGTIRDLESAIKREQAAGAEPFRLANIEDFKNVIAEATARLKELGTTSNSVSASVGGLTSSVQAAASAFAQLAEQSKVFYNSVNPSALAAASKELQNQLDIVRQLGGAASDYSSVANSQLQTRLSVLRAQSDAMRQAAADEERAGAARAKFASQIAPQSNVAAHNALIREQIVLVKQLLDEEDRLNATRSKFQEQLAPKSSIDERRRLNKDTYDTETAQMERQAAKQRQVANEMIENLKRINAEEQKAAADRERFQKQLAPSSSLAERQAINKYTFDQETEGWARVAAAQKRATDEMLSNLKRFQAEEQKADKERAKFQEQMAPRSRVSYEVDRSGNLKAVKADLDAAEGAAGNLGRSLQHVTAIFDGMMRGQRGQVVASLTALTRDSGVLENTVARLTGMWGIFAAAGVAAAVAVGYAIEQMYQRWASIRETTAQAAIQGFGADAILNKLRLRRVRPQQGGDQRVCRYYEEITRGIK
jgi:hypothetical protein